MHSFLNLCFEFDFCSYRPSNSTKSATFYAGFDPTTKHKRSKVTEVTGRVDNNGNIALSTQRSSSLRRKGKENAGGDVLDASLQPKTVPSRREIDPFKEKVNRSVTHLKWHRQGTVLPVPYERGTKWQSEMAFLHFASLFQVKSSTLSLNNLLRHQPKFAQNQSSKPKTPTTVPNHVFLRR